MRSLVVSTLLLLLVVAGPAAAFDDSHDTSTHAEQAVTTDSSAASDTSRDATVPGQAGEAMTDESGVHGETAAAHGETAEENHEGGGVMEHLAHHLLDAKSYDIFGYSIALPVIKGDYSFLGEKYAHGFQIT
jgi:hypothetical protein